MKTIIIDGKTIEISEESFNAFKKQFSSTLPTSFEGLDTVAGFSLSPTGTPMPHKCSGSVKLLANTLFYSIKDLEMALAMAQLSQLKVRYVDDWEPDWKSDCYKYCIYPSANIIQVHFVVAAYSYLTFPNKELAEKFLNNFKPLIKQYFGMEE